MVFHYKFEFCLDDNSVVKMTTLEEYVELFLTWIPLLASKVFVYQITRGLYPARVIDTKDLSIRHKLLVRRRAASFHYANQHDINIMFCENSILFSKKAPEDQYPPRNLMQPPQSQHPPITILRQATTGLARPFPSRTQHTQSDNEPSEPSRPYSTR